MKRKSKPASDSSEAFERMLALRSVTLVEERPPLESLAYSPSPTELALLQRKPETAGQARETGIRRSDAQRPTEVARGHTGLRAAVAGKVAEETRNDDFALQQLMRFGRRKRGYLTPFFHSLGLLLLWAGAFTVCGALVLGVLQGITLDDLVAWLQSARQSLTQLRGQ